MLTGQLLSRINLIPFAFTVICALPLYGQIDNTLGAQIALLDSLLLQGDTKRLQSMLHDPLPQIPKTDTNQRSFNWDSVKTVYVGLLASIEEAATTSVENQKHFTEMFPLLSGRYAKQDAGPDANRAYEKLNDLNASGMVTEAQKYYVVANYFRTKYIEGEKQRLLNNAAKLEHLLEISNRQLLAMNQERNSTAAVKELDEAAQLRDMYEAENRQTAAFRLVASELDTRYEKLKRELNNQISERTREQEADFKEIRFAFGVFGGAFFSSKEFFPPYTLIADINNGGTITRTITSFEGVEDPSNQRRTYWGQTIAIVASYFLKDNISIELNYSYAKINRTRPSVTPWENQPFVLPEYSSPITYSSIEVIIDYLMRIKTGFRPFTGAGLNFTTSNAPESQSFPEADFYGTFVSSPLGKATSLRAIARAGIEYLPSERSVLSYAVLVDASFKLTSSKDIAAMFIQSCFRVSWLL